MRASADGLEGGGSRPSRCQFRNSLPEHRRTSMIPDIGPRKTPKAEMADIKELAVWRTISSLVAACPGNRITNIENAPWIDAYADDSYKHGAAADVDEAIRAVLSGRGLFSNVGVTHRGNKAARSMPPTTPHATT